MRDRSLAIFSRRAFALLARIPFIGALGCSKSRKPIPKTKPQANQPALVNVEQRGKDTYADFQVRHEWIDEGRTVPVDIPGGRSIQVVLHASMTDGAVLRLKGQAPGGNGDLLLRIRITTD
jgi:hypothetical protein